MPLKRVGHRKSRDGCTRCKARRVKCDEKRPCTNCVRHEVHCSLLGIASPEATQSPSSVSGDFPPPIAVATPASTTSDADVSTPGGGGSGDGVGSGGGQARSVRSEGFNDPQPCSEIGQHIHHYHHHPHHPLHPLHHHQDYSTQILHPTTTLEESNAYYSPEWMQSLRLIHHYSNNVYVTLSRDECTAEIWKTAVPEIACTNDSLMHGLLAISALHYSQTHPDQRRKYSIVSAVYQGLALRDMPEQMAHINEDNCEAMFLLASMIFMLTMCSISNPQDWEKPPGLGDVARSFKLLQGVRSILDFRPIQRWREGGPLAPLLRPLEVHPEDVKRTGAFHRRMDKLTELARELPSSFEVINPRTACLLAIESLRATHAATANDLSPSASRRVWVWACSLPQLFNDMIRDGHTLALVILAHYAALARPYEVRSWASKGWSASVRAILERSLTDQQDQMLGWFAWPNKSLLEEIRVDDMESLDEASSTR